MVELRPSRSGDEQQVSVLLRQLGYDVSGGEVQARPFKLAGRQTDPALGLIALHWTAMLHAPTPVARITTLVVHDRAGTCVRRNTLVALGRDHAGQ